MFLCAVAHRCFDDDGEVLFHEELGIVLFVETVMAKRNSRKGSRALLSCAALR